MKNRFFKIATLAILSLGTFSCKKDYEDYELSPLQDNLASIPVTVTNAEFNERFPIITTSIAAGGLFTVDFEIPADKGIIREISKVTTTAQGTINLTNLNSAAPVTALNRPNTSANAPVQPILGNGTNRISFSSTLASYVTFRQSQPASQQATFGPAPNAVTNLPVPSTTQAPTEIQYYFRIVLEDGTTIIPMPVRIRVLP